MWSTILLTASAALIAFLGAAHLLLTLTSAKLHPRSQALEEQMRQIAPVISAQTTMWNAWVGFNASHALGALLFGLLYGYLAITRPDLVLHAWPIAGIGLAYLGGMLWLARRCWFDGPFAGIAMALALYLAGLGTAWI